MAEVQEYKTTFFDRHGPVAATYLKAGAAGVGMFIMAFTASVPRLGLLGGVALSLALGLVTGGTGIVLGNVAAGAASWYVFGGNTTPYIPQHSYQDALIMQGRIDDALRSFEAMIAGDPRAADVRLRAAELYAKNEHSVNRAADLFREVQRIDGVATADDVYATNRLVDLLIGPLNNPTRALVELRQLIDRHPGTSAASRARETLAVLKARYVPQAE